VNGVNPLLRLGGILVAAYVGWALLNAYAGTVFLLCTAVAGWRLWRTAAAVPGQRGTSGAGSPAGAGRPGNPASPGQPPSTSHWR